MNIADYIQKITNVAYYAGVLPQPNRRRYLKRIDETWNKVYYFKLNCNSNDRIREELLQFVLSERKNREFYFYHDHSKRRWYFSDSKVAVAVKLKWGGEISCSVRK